ncbi:MAG: hypothetical protein ABIO70_02760 [Pseudomonadota bacterium]
MRALLLLPLIWACRCGAPDDTGPALDDTSDSTPPQGPALDLQLVLPEDTSLAGPVTVGAVEVRFGAGPALGPTIASVSAGEGSAALALPAAPEEPPTTVLGHDPYTVGTLYMLATFEDSDGDGAFQEGEPLLGVAMDRFLLWLHAESDDSAAQSLDEWRLVDLGIGGQYAPNRCALDTSWPMEWMADRGYPVEHALDEPITVTLRGLPAHLTLGGAVEDLPEGSWRLAGLPYPWVGKQAVTAAFDLDLPASAESFAVALQDAPPTEDDVGADPDWRYTMHLPLVFADGDGSGGWSEGDTPEGTTTCYQGREAWARYTRPVSAYRGYRFLDCYGGTVGWRAAHTSSDGYLEYLTSEQALSLVLDGATCRLD